MAFPTKLLNEGEHVVVSTRTHVKALILPVLGLVVGLALALFLDGRLGLLGIPAAIDDALQALAGSPGGTRDALLEADAAARRRVHDRHGC